MGRAHLVDYHAQAWVVVNHLTEPDLTAIHDTLHKAHERAHGLGAAESSECHWCRDNIEHSDHDPDHVRARQARL